jgi:hypothetical protein
MIKESKFVKDAEKSHKPGYRATGKPLFVPTQDDATLRKLLATYFDPMTHIDHHVRPRSSGNKIDLLTKQQYAARSANGLIESELQTNVRLIRALATDLPPPATPHRSRSKAIAASDDGSTSTPLPSAFDMRKSQDFVATSETLQQTPTMRTRRFTQKNKRALDAEEAEESASKRLATPTTNWRQFTSLRSSRMIDANEKSSPYQK